MRTRLSDWASCKSVDVWYVDLEFGLTVQGPLTLVSFSCPVSSLFLDKGVEKHEMF